MTEQPASPAVGRRKEGAEPVPPLLFRPYRLPSPVYKDVLAAKKSWPGRLTVLWVLPSAADRPRMGVVVSKRTLRESVDRARARRLLRESFRLLRPNLAAGCDVILMARFRIEGATCADVMRDVEKLCRKAGIWRGCGA